MHSANCEDTTRSCTRIGTSIVLTSLIQWTIRISDTFASTSNIRVALVRWDALADGHRVISMITNSTLGVRSARAWHTNVFDHLRLNTIALAQRVADKISFASASRNMSNYFAEGRNTTRRWNAWV